MIHTILTKRHKKRKYCKKIIKTKNTKKSMFAKKIGRKTHFPRLYWKISVR